MKITINNNKYTAEGITHDIIMGNPGMMIWGIKNQKHSIFVQYKNIKNLNIMEES